MTLSRLQQLAEDFSDISPSEFEDLAESCRDLAINRLDVRFMILAECFRLSWDLWGDGDGAAVTQGFADALRRIWADYLPGVLQAATEEEGTAVSLALREELVILSGNDPLHYEG